MSELGFSIDQRFSERSPSPRRGAGSIGYADLLIKAVDPAQVEMYVRLALFGALVAALAAMLAWPDQAATLLRHLVL